MIFQEVFETLTDAISVHLKIQKEQITLTSKLNFFELPSPRLTPITPSFFTSHNQQNYINLDEIWITKEIEGNDFGLEDQLDVLELVIAIEEKFDIEILEEEIDKIKTIQDLVELIQNSLSKN